MALTAFNTDFPKLYITAETDDASQFDQKTLKYWHEEGFDIEYIPFGNGGVEYVNVLKSLRVGLGMGEAFGIVGMFFFRIFSMGRREGLDGGCVYGGEVGVGSWRE